MTKIKLSQADKETVTTKLQQYLLKELEIEIGQFDAEFLLDFFAENIGAYFYNQGLYDAQSLLSSRIESLTEAFYEIEKPTP